MYRIQCIPRSAFVKIYCVSYNCGHLLRNWKIRHCEKPQYEKSKCPQLWETYYRFLKNRQYYWRRLFKSSKAPNASAILYAPLSASPCRNIVWVFVHFSPRFVISMSVFHGPTTSRLIKTFTHCGPELEKRIVIVYKILKILNFRK